MKIQKNSVQIPSKLFKFKARFVNHKFSCLCAVLVLIAEALDIVTTRFAINAGIATEANPIMHLLLSSNMAFIAVKLGVAIVCSAIFLSPKFDKGYLEFPKSTTFVTALIPLIAFIPVMLNLMLLV